MIGELEVPQAVASRSRRRAPPRRQRQPVTPDAADLKLPLALPLRLASWITRFRVAGNASRPRNLNVEPRRAGLEWQGTTAL
jgi:hypothetical protein